ncbi:glycosyltransferase family 2 protein [Candidatus Omnitrophota bacterium]
MKLFIQIPCLNEEATLPSVITGIPRPIEGIDEIYTLVIDDGSTDRTVEVAKSMGVDYIVKNNVKQGLSKTFCNGLEVALALGADIIVNLDGDNQYKGSDIPKLIRPICNKRADIVLGCRDNDANKENSLLKKMLHKVGSRIASRFSDLNIPDATTGFRAISRHAARRIVVRCDFSYTLEMLCQSRRIGLKVAWEPIGVNAKTRESHLFTSYFEYVLEQVKILAAVFLEYYPLAFFIWLAIALFSVSVLAVASKSLLLANSVHSVLLDKIFYIGLFMAAVSLFCGLIGSILASLHILLIEIRSRVRSLELDRDILQRFDIEKSHTRESSGIKK